MYDGDPAVLPAWYQGEDFRDSSRSRPTSPGPGSRTTLPAVSFRDLVFRYPGCREPALSIGALDIFPGEVTVIQGTNGSGKSTLIRHLNGLLVPDSGQLFVRGLDARVQSTAELSRVVGVLLQHADYQLFGETVEEELAFGPENIGVPADRIAERIRETAEELAVGELGLSTPPLGLSAGEKQRVAIASLLVMQTPIVVLDEPTLGLDRRCKRTVGRVLRRLADGGAVVIVATHDEEFSRLIRDRLIVLEEGRIVSDSRETGRDAWNATIVPDRSGGPDRG